MNSIGLQLRGDWNLVKGKLKRSYANLTDDDLLYVKGHEDELMGRLERRLGKTQAQVTKLIADNI